tara:strand:+ start:1496 stop:1987 length:492 start_codon:yes stop_codon:yes gene_type:complete
MKDIKYLTKDLEKLVEDAVAESAVEIRYGLQHKGPWWTGSFGKNWAISPTPVEPTLPRDLDVDVPATRVPTRAGKITVPFGSPVYIGNKVEYAGFAVNNPSSKLPNEEGELVTYAQHLQTKKSTVSDDIPNKPRWWPIYLKHKSFLPADMDKGFSKAGFSITS